MKLEIKSSSFYIGQIESISIPEYSKIIDIDIYKGGYDGLCYKVYYITPNNSNNLKEKKVHLLQIVDSGIVIPDGFDFLKSNMLDLRSTSCLILTFIKYDLSTSESRELKINDVVSKD